MAEIAGYPRDFEAVPSAVPVTETVPNQNFLLPHVEPPASHRRLKSMSAAALPRPTGAAHRRGASAALPSFSFNANDTSGLTDDISSDQTDSEALLAPVTPSRGAHKRNTSEYVGGLGMTGAISSSPTRSSALPVPRSQHRYGHSRSQLTLSSHDLSSIMSPPEPQPRLSASLPNTPLEHPAVNPALDPVARTFGPSLEDNSSRPPSRPRVEFSDSVEYIPRPLSTISSETGSSMSTVRGHSVNNSISSVLSWSNQSPASARVRATSLGTTLEHEPTFVPRSSLEVSRRVEKEGQWLRAGSVGHASGRPLTEFASGQSSQLHSAEEGHSSWPRSSTHRKQRSLSNNLGFDRRKSEPSMSACAGEPSRLSALSLQDEAVTVPSRFEEPLSAMDQRSSSRRLKDWAVSKLLPRKSKDAARPLSAHNFPSAPANTVVAAPAPVAESAVAETDLDAVFSLDTAAMPNHTMRAPDAFDVGSARYVANGSSGFVDSDDHGTMLDLDAALGPFQTPPLGAQRSRRELHSSRGTKDFIGPGGHYLPDPSHRRTESAPMLTAFDYGRTSTPPQTAMADVFEEDEEEVEALTAQSSRLARSHSGPDEEASMGVRIVDSDMSANSSTPSLSLDDGLGIQHGEWEAERPTTSHGNLASRLSTAILDRRPSVIEDTITEESSPTEPTIVESHEEPRAHSFTKSSNSSETPTIIATQPDVLAPPGAHHQSETPESYQPSAFSSPDVARRQSSFETSRGGTSASSIADTRTMSSCTTGEPCLDVHTYSDDVPSLTSSRSTMISTMHANASRRDVSGAQTPSSGILSGVAVPQTRRKRDSIQSLSQLVGGSFGPRSNGSNASRPQTATDAGRLSNGTKKEHHRLKKLMFWKSKTKQTSASTMP